MACRWVADLDECPAVHGGGCGHFANIRYGTFHQNAPGQSPCTSYPLSAASHEEDVQRHGRSAVRDPKSAKRQRSISEARAISPRDSWRFVRIFRAVRKTRCGLKR